MKRIFFFDVDNTLLDHRTHAVPQSALDAIAGLKQAGHTVVIATGRSYGHARPHIEDIPANYTITLNGACILKDGKVVQSRPLDRTALLDLFALMRDLGHAFGVNQGESCYVSEETPEAMIPLQGVRMPTQSHDPFYLREDVCQGWLFFDETHDPRFMPVLFERYPEFDFVRWHRTAVDVMPKAVNKWTGCQWVLAATGFTPEQAIAFGDGLNDREMLKGVGLGIAMGNGHPELKEIADRVAPPLDEDGIARMLNQLATEAAMQ